MKHCNLILTAALCFLLASAVSGQSILDDLGEIYLEAHKDSYRRHQDMEICLKGNCDNTPGIQYIRKSSIEYLYAGGFKNGKFEGEGEMSLIRSANDIKPLYRGQYQDGFRHGTGTSYDLSVNTRYPLLIKETTASYSGYYYTGEHRRDRRHGVGTYYTSSDQKIYAGEFSNDNWYGEGKLYNRKGQLLYEGDFKNNLQHGYGTSYYPGGQKKYSGGWAFGKYDGQGNLHAPSGYLFARGAFSRGFIAGDTKLYYSNGSVRYDGFLNHNGTEGRGTYLFQNGAEFKGSWNYGDLNQSKGPIVRGQYRLDDQLKYKSICAFEPAGDNEEIFNSRLDLMYVFLGDLGPRRFEGTRKLIDPFQWPRNYEAGIRFMGPKYTHWHRIYLNVFINSRAYAFDGVGNELYMPSYLVNQENSIERYIPLWLENGSERRSPAIMITQELGLGLQTFFPNRNGNRWLVGGGVVAWQQSNIRFDPTPFEDQSLTMLRKRFVSVMNHPQMEPFASLGIATPGFQFEIRTYYRGESSLNHASPLYTRDENTNEFHRFEMTSVASRFRPVVNLGCTVPTWQRKSRLEKRRNRKVFPFLDYNSLEEYQHW